MLDEPFEDISHYAHHPSSRHHHLVWVLHSSYCLELYRRDCLSPKYGQPLSIGVCSDELPRSYRFRTFADQSSQWDPTSSLLHAFSGLNKCHTEPSVSKILVQRHVVQFQTDNCRQQLGRHPPNGLSPEQIHHGNLHENISLLYDLVHRFPLCGERKNRSHQFAHHNILIQLRIQPQLLSQLSHFGEFLWYLQNWSLWWSARQPGVQLCCWIQLCALDGLSQS